ncbi:L-histidine N(alpha)-methyltransferase [Streptomyces iconiensis]|uniref:L-histidine N(Alpha)-methyltransferase n=1 Tax=Streptomyces iconiensis TaxID=1384038 RepID=A0ABT7A275_9ACTN|nr:L-histidine N(alpha)-methyltransferase [Streptomyces iconiensis]MDJ1135440.1 L-histidine N(alpha)-methyltransferase [Streptomyces iconiensis]
MSAIRGLIDVRVDDATSGIRDLIAGLSKTPRVIPTVYGYDERGSEIYAQICDLKTYYPYHAEWALLTRNIDSICDQAGTREIVELGCGTATKTELLLSRMAINSQAPLRYVPIDVSEEMLRRTSVRLADSIESLEIHPIAGDYHSGLSIVGQRPEASRLFLFMGSSLGNMSEEKRRELLGDIRSAGRRGDLMAIGVDFDKSRSTLENAYNDPPEYDLWHNFLTNRLTCLNRTFDGNFDPSAFDSRLTYNTDACRMEAQIWPRVDVEFRLDGLDLQGVIKANERVTVDTSHKFKPDELNELLSSTGMRIMASYDESAVKYSLLLLEMM